MEESIESVFQISKSYLEQSQDRQKVTFIGKHWEEKLIFLNFLLHNENLSLNESSNAHLLVQSWKVSGYRETGFNEFDVILMKAFDEIQSDSQLSVFLLSSAFCISSTVIIQIMQNELDDGLFIENFAFFYLQSALASLKKHIPKLPKMALVIFADNNDQRSMMDYDMYARIVEDFFSMVNICISEYVERIDNLIGKTKVKPKKNFNAHIDMNQFRDPIKDIRLSVKIICIYNKNNNAYVEIKKKDNHWDSSAMGEKSLWFKLKNRSAKAKQNRVEQMDYSPKEISGIKNDTTFNIRAILREKKMPSCEYIIESLYTEIKYNSLIKYRKPIETQKIIKFFKELIRSSKKFEKIFVRKSKKKINDVIIDELKQNHNEIINELFFRHIADNDLLDSVYDNFKYLLAIEFSFNFSLNLLMEDSFCYEILKNIMLLEVDSEKLELGLRSIEMNINFYKSLTFYNENYEDMLKFLLTNKIDFNKCIFELYEKIIDETVNDNYKYKAVLEMQIDHYQQCNYQAHILKLASILENYATLNDDYKKDIKALLRLFKKLHKEALLGYNKDLILYDMEKAKLVMNMRTETLRSRTLFRALTPTAAGLTFGLINALAPVSAIPGLSLSMLFIGAITTSALIIYPFFKNNDTKTVKFEYHADENYIIVDEIIIEKLDNATEDNKTKLISNDKKKFKYSYTFSVNKNQIKSARFNAKIFLVCALSNAPFEQIKIERQVKFENNCGDSLNLPMKK